MSEAQGFLFFLILLGSVATMLRLVDRTRSTVPYPVLLAAGAELVALAGPAIPNPDWAARCRLLLAVVAFASSAPDDRAARAAAIYATLSEYQHDLARVGTYPHMRQGVEAVNEVFDHWSIGALRSWADLDPADGV